MYTNIVYPNEILESIERHKSKSDPYGDSAFKINIDYIRKSKNNTKFINFSVLKKIGKEEKPVSLNIKFISMPLRSKIKSYDEREYGLQLQFRKSSTFKQYIRDPKTKKITNTIIQKYGEAKIAIAAAFRRIMQKYIDEKKIFHSKTNFSTCGIQNYIKEGNKQTKIEDPIIRVSLEFQKKPNETKAGENALPKINIYDVDHVLNPRPKKGMPFRLSKDCRSCKDCQEGKETCKTCKICKGKDCHDCDVTAGGIHGYITCGSALSGVDNMSSVSLSSMGISVKSSFSFLIVKKSKGFKITSDDVNDQDDYNDMLNEKVETEDESSSEESKEIIKKEDNNQFDDFIDELDK